eukprot:2118432-Amphidinium_carterae.1
MSNFSLLDFLRLRRTYFLEPTALCAMSLCVLCHLQGAWPHGAIRCTVSGDKQQHHDDTLNVVTGSCARCCVMSMCGCRMWLNDAFLSWGAKVVERPKPRS